MDIQNYFDDELLEKIVNTFYGYGNYQANYWFIGMEEAGGDFKDINNRISIWSNRGKQELEDLAEYHIAIGYGEMFQLGAAIQPTWNKLIRTVLSAKGVENIDKEDVRKYQINLLGRKNQETCLLELLPLPSPSLAHWIYSQHSRLPFLANKNSYENYCLEKRISHLRSQIKEYKPKAVIFYGKLYEYSWRKITSVEFSSSPEGLLIGKNCHTLFVIAKHPIAFGVPNEYFHNIGKSIAAM